MEEFVEISFEYSPELEIKRLNYTLSRLEWYLDNGYKIEWMSFPRALDQDKLSRISEEEIFQAVKGEYTQVKYKEAARYLENAYLPFKLRLREFINQLSLSVVPTIFVQLTAYGMGGSYHPPNRVVCNIAKYSGEQLLRNLLHEIIHLHIEHSIKEYKVGQWEKEALVNLLFESAFPELYMANNSSPIDTKTIERIYRENFPNIAKIASMVGNQP